MDLVGKWKMVMTVFDGAMRELQEECSIATLKMTQLSAKCTRSTFMPVYTQSSYSSYNRSTLLDCGCTVHSCLCTHRVPKVATVATTGVHCGIVGNKKKILKKRRSIFFIILECICVPVQIFITCASPLSFSNLQTVVSIY